MARKKKVKEEPKEEIVKVAEMIVVKRYYDTFFRGVIEIGDGFECSQKRAKELVDAKVAEIVCLKNSL